MSTVTHKWEVDEAMSKVFESMRKGDVLRRMRTQERLLEHGCEPDQLDDDIPELLRYLRGNGVKPDEVIQAIWDFNDVTRAMMDDWRASERPMPSQQATRERQQPEQVREEPAHQQHKAQHASTSLLGWDLLNNPFMAAAS